MQKRNRFDTKLPTVTRETVALFQPMARENRLWGAERIRGELLKLSFSVAKPIN